MGRMKYWVKRVVGDIVCFMDRDRYLDYIGLNHGTDIHIYGNPAKMFGTEPWCITLGNHVHITDGVRFVTHDGGTLIFRHLVPDLEITKPIVVGDYVYIGIQSIILPGVSIGSHCIIAAGSVVTKDIPDHSVAGGIPARVMKSSEEYFEKIQRESLHVGQFTYEEKDKKLKEFYGYKK